MTALFPLADFTPAQAERRDRIEAAPEPPEVTVEKVARALHDFHAAEFAWTPGWEGLPDWARNLMRRLAAVAIAATPAHPAEAAVKRVEALADELDRDARTDRDTVLWVTTAFRAAIAAPQTGEHATDEEADRG